LGVIPEFPLHFLGPATTATVAGGEASGYAVDMSDSPYLFPANRHPLRDVTDRLKVREAVSGFGIALRYQERAPDPPQAAESSAPEAEWCETGHSIFILSGAFATASTATRWRRALAICFIFRPGTIIGTSPVFPVPRSSATS
jgi:hypothetical protein